MSGSNSPGPGVQSLAGVAGLEDGGAAGLVGGVVGDGAAGLEVVVGLEAFVGLVGLVGLAGLDGVGEAPEVPADFTGAAAPLD